jgi:hypothetical protein
MIRSFSSICVPALALAVLSAHADVITDWNTEALNAIRSAKTPPPKASRALAMLHASMYDAVNGVHPRYEAYAVSGNTPDATSKEAAAGVAAHVVLSSLFPTRAANLDAQLARTLDAVPRGPRKQMGIAWGQTVAQQILALRANDGSSAVIAPPSNTGPGFWEPTPAGFAAYLLPQWGFVTPFTMASSAQFRPPGPPALDSAKYAADYNEVKALGAAVGSTRTPDQSQIALFWADGGGTETPPGHWNSIAQSVALAQGNTLDENARLFALLNLAMADAAICAWDAKFTFDFWRPVTAIRKGDTDGNPATDPDATWSSFIATPPFPDYVSGHSTFSGAASFVLAAFYGTDDVSFTTGSDALPGVTRSFPSFSAAAAEAADSRLFGGIHFRAANEDGLEAGLNIGDWASRRYLLPKRSRNR